MIATTTLDYDAIRARQKVAWTAGDFGQIAQFTQTNAEEIVRRCAIEPGMRVLDVACGTGNTALPAARAGGQVTALDFAPNLLEQARARAAREGLTIRFEESDMEALPHADASFDLVMSTFGVMFAPRPDLVAAELIRVCRPGGKIVLASWTADGFIGQIQQIMATYSPPPPAMVSPLQWGEQDVVARRLRAGIVAFHAGKMMAQLRYPFSIAETIRFHRTYLGPAVLTYASLSASQRDAVEEDLTALYQRHNLARDGTVWVEAEYLEFSAIRA
ncbi:MAG TPA: class I SAM-dependent methyltransferase [Dongiaceae bacterium]